MNQKQLAVSVIGFYFATHAIAWLVTDGDKMIYRLVPVLLLAVGFLLGQKLAQKFLAFFCALYALAGLSVLLRLESDFLIYLAIGFYTAGSAALSWLVFRFGGSAGAAGKLQQ